MNDTINSPSHYMNNDVIHSVCQEPIECIDVSEQYSGNVAQSIQYLWRHLHKGNPVEDLRKAAWFANREADRLEALYKSNREVAARYGKR